MRLDTPTALSDGRDGMSLLPNHLPNQAQNFQRRGCGSLNPTGSLSMHEIVVVGISIKITGQSTVLPRHSSVDVPIFRCRP